MRECNKCRFGFLGSDGDPCPRCGGWGLDNDGERVWNQNHTWLVEIRSKTGDRGQWNRTCHSLNECRAWSADYQSRWGNIWTITAICVETGEAVELPVFGK